MVGRRQRGRHGGGGARPGRPRRQWAAPGRGGQLNRGARRRSTAGRRHPALPPRRHHAAGRGRRGRARRGGRGRPGGAFLVRFDADRPMQRLGSWLINRRTRWLRVPLGDQAQFGDARGFRDGWAASPTGRSSRTSTSCGGCGGCPASRSIEEPVTTAARRFVELGVGADGGDQLADLAAVPRRRLAAPAGAALPADPLSDTKKAMRPNKDAEHHGLRKIAGTLCAGWRSEGSGTSGPAS